MSDKVLSPQEAANYLGITPMTLAKWRKVYAQDLPYIKLGNFYRYRMSDIENFLNNKTVPLSKKKKTLNKESNLVENTL